MPYFCRSGHPVVTVELFLDCVDSLLPQEPVLDLPRISGQDCLEVARAKKSTAGGLNGWAWNEISSLPSVVLWTGYPPQYGGDFCCLASGFVGCIYCHDT